MEDEIAIARQRLAAKFGEARECYLCNNRTQFHTTNSFDRFELVAKDPFVGRKKQLTKIIRRMIKSWMQL